MDPLSVLKVNADEYEIVDARARADKQDTLVSGTNIKTINGESVLGSGDIPIAAGDTVTIQQTLSSGTEIGGVTVNGSQTKLYAPTPPTKTSELTNDSNFVSDANYVHTDNNYTDADKAKVDSLQVLHTTSTTYSFTAKAAAARGYFQVPWGRTLTSSPFHVKIDTASISALNGTQFSVVHATDTSAYITYYCPAATTQTITLTIAGYYF